MFNFEQEFRRNSIPAARQAARQSLEQKQRDVFESHRHRVFSLAFYMTGNELEAEEILTATFVRAFERDEQPDRPEIDSELMEQIFDRFPSMRHPTTASRIPAVDGPGLGTQQVLRTDLEIAIRGLCPVERLLFLLRDVEGYAIDAAGELLGISRQQAQTTLLSARLHLRQSLAAVGRRSSEAA